MSKPAPGFRKSLQNLIFFQFKLAADALRDFLLSPISILMFILDVILKPSEASYYDRLMSAGRKSDRLINLFEEHSQVEPTQESKLIDSNVTEKSEE